MINLDKVFYDQRDLFNLIKNNTSLFADCRPEDLFVHFEVRNKEVRAVVMRKDKKKLIINE